MTHPRLLLLPIMVVAISPLLFWLLLMIGCDGGRITAVPSNAKSNLNLTFYNKAPLDAITQPTPHTLAWSGSRVVGGMPAAGDSFPGQVDQVTTDTASWQSNQVSIPNLNPGDWTISVTVDGLTRTCPATDADAAGQGGVHLDAGKTNWVSVQFDESANSVYCSSGSA